MAHVALPDHASLGVVLGDAIRTVPCAVLTTDAGIRAVMHDAHDGILRVGVNRAAGQTCRLEAVVAPHRQKRSRDVRKKPAFDLAHTPPVDRGRVAVLFVASDDTAFAADAFAHVEVKSVLLAWTRCTCRHPQGSDSGTTRVAGGRGGRAAWGHVRQRAGVAAHASEKWECLRCRHVRGCPLGSDPDSSWSDL